MTEIDSLSTELECARDALQSAERRHLTSLNLLWRAEDEADAARAYVTVQAAEVEALTAAYDALREA